MTEAVAETDSAESNDHDQPAAERRPRAAAYSSLISAGGMLVFLFGSGILSARTLGPTDRGYFALVTLVPTVLCQLTALGLSLAVTHYVASQLISAADSLRALRRDITVQVLGTATLTLVIGQLVNARHGWESQVAAAVIVIFPFTSTTRDYGLAIIQGCGESVKANMLRVVPAACWLVAIGFCFFAARGSFLTTVVAFAIAECASAAIIGTAARRVVISTSADVPPRAAREEIVRFGRRAYVSYLSPLDSFHVDQLTVGAVGSPTQLGWYAASNAFTNISRVIALNVGLTASPVVAALNRQGRARRAAILFVSLTVGSSVLVAVVLGASVGWLIPFLYGEAFRPAVPVCRVLLVAGVVLATRRIVGDVLRGGGRTFGAIPDVLALVTFAAVSPVLWNAYGLVGIAWAFTAGATAGLLTIALTHSPATGPGMNSAPSAQEIVAAELRDESTREQP